MAADFASLLDELDQPESSGPTVGDSLRSDQMHELLTKTLQALSQPKQDTGHSELTQAVLEMMQKLQVPQSAPPTVNVAPAQVTVQPQTRCSWEFSFTRNPDGTIKSIKATPVKE